MFKDKGSDEVHGFLLYHSVNGSTEGVQRTDTHDDVDDGMVVDSGPLVEFRDKFGSEKGEVWQRGFLDTTRFGRDVILCTMLSSGRSCEPPFVKKAHGKPSRHVRSGPLEVHLLPCPHLLEWVDNLKTRFFVKPFHVRVVPLTGLD